jgi:uncharacterized membrane protein YgcG
VRRRLPLAVALTLALAAPAHGADHLMTVNEIGLSVGGQQFVELFDPATEPFPSPPYKLVVYNSAGAEQGEQVIKSDAISPNPVTGRPMLLAAAPVGGQTPDATLSVALPTDAGQACFTRGMAEAPIFCLRWGTIAMPIGAGASGPTPGAEQSLQRCPTAAVVSAPTPKAENACSGSGGGGGGGGVPGGGGGGGGGGTTGDTVRPRASASFPRQTLNAVRSRGLKIRVRSNEAGRVRAQLVRRGRVLRTITRALRANVRRELTLTLPLADRRALRNAGSATFSVRLRVTDAAGNVRTLTRSILLRAAR